MKQKAFTLIELIVVCAIILLTLSILFGAIGSCTVSDGYRDGIIQKFSYKGTIWKTNEGELAEGQGFSMWPFTVYDEAIVKQINELPPGTQVRLHYHQRRFVMPWNGSTNYEVTKITTQ